MNLKKQLRAEMKYTETSVKELSYKTGISQSTLNNYLGKNTVQPTIENGVKIARAIIEIVRKMPRKRQARLLKLLKTFAPPDITSENFF